MFVVVYFIHSKLTTFGMLKIQLKKNNSFLLNIHYTLFEINMQSIVW